MVSYKQLQSDLREIVQILRRTPTAISICIPHLQKAADGLEAMEIERASLRSENAALRAYVQHLPNCHESHMRAMTGDWGNGTCNCGLAALRAQESRDE